jgi:mRNA interferase RelE/StbE
MSYIVIYEPDALADLEKLSQAVRQRIVNKINWLAENFEQITPQPLSNQLSGFFKLRVGDYRIIYEFSSAKQTIIIDRVGHRSQIYDLM